MNQNDGGGKTCGNTNCQANLEQMNNKNNKQKNRICWDFLKGTCRRGQCRYPHVASPDFVVFCHDYQNTQCPRINCKFLHYTLDEEEHYRNYGEFPPCLDYTKYGTCRHRICQNIASPPGGQLMQNERVESPPSIWAERIYRAERSLLPSFRLHSDEYASLKRSVRDVPLGSSTYKRFREESDRSDILMVLRRFEDEQRMLQRRVDVNEIKIAELRASNEYLMAQNAQLRLNNACSTVVNPVTVTQTTSQPQTPQVMGGVSIAPVQVQATPIVSIATPQTQIIANSAPPLAIAANTSQGQQLAIAQQNITSLSNTNQPLAASHAQQILGTSQITLAPAIAQGASMGLTINTSQALAMSNATQPIISYPVMTHSILPH